MGTIHALAGAGLPTLTDPGAAQADALQLIREDATLYGSKVAIILSHVCNIACRHCLSRCGPEAKEALDWPIVAACLDELSKLPQTRSVCFSGGEPFLRRALLARAIAYCHVAGLETAVVSNAYWARTPEQARATLALIPSLGSLGISTDVFHREFISVDRIRNAIRACAESNIKCVVQFCFLSDKQEEVDRLQVELADVEGLFELRTQPVVLMGRAKEEVDPDSLFGYDPARAGCRSVDMPTVNPCGSVSACCGSINEWPSDHPLNLGSVQRTSLASILGKAERDYLVHAIRVWGVGGLVEVAKTQAEREGTALLVPMLRDVCSLCFHLLTDRQCRGLLSRALERPRVRHQIAAARLLELGEASMLLAEKEESPRHRRVDSAEKNR